MGKLKHVAGKLDPIDRKGRRLILKMSKLKPVGLRRQARDFLTALYEQANTESREEMRKQMIAKLHEVLNGN